MARRWTLLMAPLMLLAVGCSQAPTDKMSEAEKIVADAKLAGAQAYAPEDFAKLEGLINNAKKEVDEQNAKFALFRNYGQAEQALASVKAETPALIETTAKKKAEAKEAAIMVFNAAKDAVKATQGLVAKAPVGKDRVAVEAIKSDAKALTGSLSDVQAALDAEDYLTAQAKAKAVLDKSNSLSTEVKSALAKIGRATAPAATKSVKATKKK
ncbi:MAG: hypothetical protein ACKOBZ_08510 [Nitrospira sp.]